MCPLFNSISFVEFDMPRGNGNNFPTMCQFLEFSGEQTCTTCDMSLFTPQVLKIVRAKIQYIIFPMK
jgi:hypothetical protein